MTDQVKRLLDIRQAVEQMGIPHEKFTAWAASFLMRKNDGRAVTFDSEE